ncbi:hypothetical protein VCRA2114E5_200087 [Vibrio crassostreae]|nr:hypothetical protein VCRA2110O4_200087 [Vibrio crassostreae]CAK1895054.1 hypothetical protein VCRA2114E5_200087 [Vibrio crassostreae]
MGSLFLVGYRFTPLQIITLSIHFVVIVSTCKTDFGSRSNFYNVALVFTSYCMI